MVVPMSLEACRSTADVLWRPQAANEYPKLSIALVKRFDAHGQASTQLREEAATEAQLQLTSLKDDWDPSATAKMHATWDDRNGWRSLRAARLLQKLRSCGIWELHLCHFLRRSSFAGMVFSPHIDLVALPHKVTQKYGLQVVEHLVHRLLTEQDDTSQRT